MTEKDFINAALELDCEHEWEIEDVLTEYVIICNCKICEERAQFIKDTN